MPRKLTTQEFIIRSQSIHSSRYGYEKSVYSTANSKITITCRIHGDVEVIAFKHMQGAGCGKCARLNSIAGVTKSKEEWLKDSLKSHNEIYSYSHIIFENYSKPVKNIFCHMCGKFFTANGSSHAKGRGGCPTSSCMEYRKKRTKLLKYGDENYNNDAKRKDTMFNRYGGTETLNSPTLLAKVDGTMIARYGVKRVAQSAYLIESYLDRYKTRKEFIFESGNKYYVQGYEDRAIQILVDLGYTEDEIQIRNRPSISYLFPKELGGDDKIHIYHPDIILPFENKIIEVKSSYTYYGSKSEPGILGRNIAKKIGAESAGFIIEFWIIDTKTIL